LTHTWTTPADYAELADVNFDTVRMDRAENHVRARPKGEIGLGL
jgi:hypothetical protein